MRTSTPLIFPGPQGELSNDKNLLDEPADHAIGHSCGGLTTKIHALVDGNQRPLIVFLGPSQGGDSPMFVNLMNALKVDRKGPGRPRTRPERALADKAYSSRATRQYLRERGIGCVIPDKDDQKANRTRKGTAGGRPVTYDREAYKRRNVVERSFNILKQWRSLATRYDKLALTYRSAAVLQAVIIWSPALGNTSYGDGDHVSNPTLRTTRKLTHHETACEEYDSYVYSQYDKCAAELSFHLNEKGKAAGIDSMSLFYGPVSRAKKPRF